MATRLICKECKNKEYKYEPLMYLSVPIMQEDELYDNIDKCFFNYFKEEIFGNEYGLTCDKCKRNNSFKKKIVITMSPHILIVHLKRFGYSNEGMIKLQHMVNYQLTSLDVTKYTHNKNKTVYDLFGICLHRGSLNFGHYYSIVYDNAISKWVFCDDYKSKVIEQNELKGRIKNPEAYLLFYIKRDLDYFKRQTLKNYL